MSLRLRLVLTLWLVTLVAGAITIGFAAAGAYETADRMTRNTLTRAGYVLERNYHMEPRAGEPLYAEMTSIKLLGLMAPVLVQHHAREGAGQAPSAVGQGTWTRKRFKGRPPQDHPGWRCLMRD